jgi:hypothetical protein
MLGSNNFLKYQNYSYSVAICLQLNDKFMSYNLTMNPMKKIAVVLTLLLSSLFSQQSFSQNAESGYLMITVYESMIQDFSKIIVIENGAKIQEVQLRNVSTKDIEYNQIQVNNTLDKYKKAGYKLVNASKGSTNIAPGQFVLISTYILEKE